MIGAALSILQVILAGAFTLACTEQAPTAPSVPEPEVATQEIPITGIQDAQLDPIAKAAPSAKDRTGRWLKARSPAIVASTDAESEARHEQLLALGYATGSNAPTGQGVSVYDEARAFEGLNFYTSGHDEVAVLMDMRGKVLHEWRSSFSDAIEGPPPMGAGKSRHWWRRGWLLENGDVIALNTGMGIMRLDKDSNVLWVNALYVHHDLEFRADGGYITLTREVHKVPWVDARRSIIEDRVVYISADGEVERSFSVLEAFGRSPFKRIVLDEISKRVNKTGDLIHTNSIFSLDGKLADRHPAFARGNLLLSFRALNAIGILDPRSETLVWFQKGEFAKQHDPKILANGNLLLFDNAGLGKRSRILEFDPIEGNVEWQYVGSREAPFFSGTCGIVEALPNGNTLITESDNGRAFEVTREGEIVWEFLSPHRAGKGGKLVATLPEVIRLPKDFPLGWLKQRD